MLVLKNASLGLLAILASLMFSTVAMAQETTELGSEAVDALGDVGTAVALIGGAMVTAIAAGIVYRWVVAFLAK